MSRSAGEKPLEWARAARDAFEASIDFIASEDPVTARLVVERVENALRQIQAHPKIGRVAGLRGRRTFSIPNTGHIVNYRETRSDARGACSPCSDAGNEETAYQPSGLLMAVPGIGDGI